MRTELKRSILLNGVLYSLFAGLLVVLVGGPMVRLSEHRSMVASHAIENDAKRNTLATGSRPEQTVAHLESMQSWMLECEQMAAMQSLRIAELSKVAEEAGVDLLSLRNMDAVRIEGEQALSYAHELSGRGSYQEIAHFLNGLSAARGMTSIDQLRIERDESDPPRTLRASLAVSWHAPCTDMPASEEGR